MSAVWYSMVTAYKIFLNDGSNSKNSNTPLILPLFYCHTTFVAVSRKAAELLTSIFASKCHWVKTRITLTKSDVFDI